jgi:hypothetical protein
MRQALRYGEAPDGLHKQRDEQQTYDNVQSGTAIGPPEFAEDVNVDAD